MYQTNLTIHVDIWWKAALISKCFGQELMSNRNRKWRFFYRSKFYLLFHWPLCRVLFTLGTIFRSSHVRTKDARKRNKAFQPHINYIGVLRHMVSCKYFSFSINLDVYTLIDHHICMLCARICTLDSYHMCKMCFDQYSICIYMYNWH